jgi:AcrR family transcriptional regulator
LAKGTLYLYFKSKRDVYLKTLQYGRTELLEEVKKKIQSAPCLRDKIRALIATRVRYSEENRDFYKIYLTEFGNMIHPAAINSEFRDLHLKQAQVLEQAFREGIERGEIRSLRVSALAFSIQDMTRSLILRRLLGWAEADVEEEVDFLWELIWKGIGH